MTLLKRCTSPTPKVSQVSNPTGTPLDSILFHCFEAWNHRPPARHQACAPSLPMPFALNLMSATVLLTCNACARACGQKRRQTMSNLRALKAICDTNIKSMSTSTKSLKPGSRIKVNGESPPKQDIAWYSQKNLFPALLVSEHPPQSQFSSYFHPISMTIWKDVQARHLSNSTKISRVSNPTGICR